MLVFFGILVCVMLLVLWSAAKRERYNLPALIAIEMSLILPLLPRALHAAARACPSAAGLMGLLWLVILPCYVIITIVAAILGMVRYGQDRAVGGFSWAIIGVLLVVGFSFIVGTNMVVAAHSARLNWLGKEHAEYMESLRNASIERQYAAKIKTFTAPDGSFAVLMPDNLDEQVMDVQDGKARGVVHTFSGEFIRHGITYCMLYYESTTGASGQRACPEILEIISNSLVHDAPARELSRSRVRNGKHPGEERVTETAEGHVIRAQYFRSQGRTYKIMAYAGTEDDARSEDAEAFFVSFKILKP